MLAAALAGTAAAEVCTSCDDCTGKLSVEGASVEFSSGMTATGDCIEMTANRTALDCKGFKLTGPSGSAGISVRGAGLVTIKNCNVRGFSNAVRLDEAYNITLESCAFEHGASSGDSLYVRGTNSGHYDHDIAGVTIDGKPLVYVFGQNGVTVGSDGAGMVFIAYSGSVTVRDLNLSYGDGLRIHHSPSAAVENVTVQGGRSTGIAAYMSPSGTYANNRLVNCSKKGLYLDSSPGSVLKGNAVNGSGEENLKVSGLACEDYRQDIDATNTVHGGPVSYYYGAAGPIGNAQAGHFSAYCSSGLAIGNVSVAAGDRVYLFRVNDSVISGITASTGIGMEECSGDNLSYVSAGSGGHAVSLINSHHNTVSRNNITGAGGNGLYLYASNNNTVSGNVIGHAEEDGIAVYLSKDNRIWGNNVSGSGGSGIAVVCSQGNAVVGCDSSRNGLYGLKLADCPNLTVEGNTFSGNSQDGIHAEGQDALTLYRIWHNNVFGNMACCGNPQVKSGFALDLYYQHQGNYWGRNELPAYVAGADSNRLDVTDLFPYWKPFGWMSVPVVTEVSIGPANVKTGQAINCSFFVSDQDNESLYANVSWWRDGLPALNETVGAGNASWASSLHPAGSHRKGENWSCSVRPYDGEEWGYTINSTGVTVANSEPATPFLLQPAPNETLAGSNVTFAFLSTDDDGDGLTYHVFLDGILFASTALNYTYALVPDGGHAWSVKASDGEANSTRSEDRPFTVETVAGGGGSAGGPGGGAAGGGSQLNITCPDWISLKQNEVKTYSVSLRNPTASGVTVHLVASSDCVGCLFRIEPSSAAVDAGQAALFQFTVIVPISEPAGEYKIWLQALEGEAERAKKTVTLKVSELPIICAEGETKCDGDRVVVCNPYRTGWVEKEACQYGCDKAKCKPEPQLCEPNVVVCDGNTVRSCNSRGNAWIASQDCIFGCENGQCVSGLDPSVIWMPLAVTVAVVSAVVALFYLRAKAKRKEEDKDREWRRLESKYMDE
jgi:parallel beta-helix repeat protein